MLFNWFDRPLIEAWLERQLSFSPKLLSATTRPRRFGRLLVTLNWTNALKKQ